MDDSVLTQYSEYVESEGSPRWINVPSPIDTLRTGGVPEQWIGPLSGARTLEERIAALWDELRMVLPRSYAVYSRNLYGLALLETRTRGWSLIYFFQMRQQLTLRRGFSPVDTLPAVAARFPVDVSPLYSLHDGLVHFMTDDAGPLPSREWESVTLPGDTEPSLIKIALHGSEALGFDVSTTPVQGYQLLPEEDEVRPVDRVWLYLDELIEGPLAHAAFG